MVATREVVLERINISKRLEDFKDLKADIEKLEFTSKKMIKHKFTENYHKAVLKFNNDFMLKGKRIDSCKKDLNQIEATLIHINSLLKVDSNRVIVHQNTARYLDSRMIRLRNEVDTIDERIRYFLMKYYDFTTDYLIYKFVKIFENEYRFNSLYYHKKLYFLLKDCKTPVDQAEAFSKFEYKDFQLKFMGCRLVQFHVYRKVAILYNMIKLLHMIYKLDYSRNQFYEFSIAIKYLDLYSFSPFLIHLIKDILAERSILLEETEMINDVYLYMNEYIRERITNSYEMIYRSWTTLFQVLDMYIEKNFDKFSTMVIKEWNE